MLPIVFPFKGKMKVFFILLWIGGFRFASIENLTTFSSIFKTLLSPVVLAGPPRLTFRKPVVLSFGHCADINTLSAWEMGVYHCDSLFSEGDDTPWVKLSSVGESHSIQVCNLD